MALNPFDKRATYQDLISLIPLANPATTKKDKWAVSISALKQLTKCNQDLIKRVIQSRSDEIEAHHATHELGQFQNSKGKLAPSITEVISLD